MMGAAMETERVNRAWAALASGDWEVARRHLSAIIDDGDPSAEVLDGLGRVLWWLKDVPGAIETRTRAFAAYKEKGKTVQAARVAVWLSRELRSLFRNDAAAGGWLARAETAGGQGGDSSVAGWISLARAEATPNVVEAIALCKAALESARTYRDSDLEVVSLARLGFVQVAAGDVDVGIKHLDESMAIATAGEAGDLQSVAEAYCTLMETAELLGDTDRFGQWTAAIAVLKASHGFGPLDELGSRTPYGNLSAFCAACCGGMYLVTGRLDDAEDERTSQRNRRPRGKRDALAVRSSGYATGRAARIAGTVRGSASLAESYEDLSEAVRPLAVLDLALGEPESAAARLSRHMAEHADLMVGALPLQTVLVDAQVATGDLDAASRSVQAIEDVAALTSSRRHVGEALFARGKVLAASGSPEASATLRDAAVAFSGASMALTACRARVELARTLVDTNRPLAISEARAALAAFDRLGAISDADAAAAFLRELGVRGRTGPKNLELLTKREVEVLRLVAQGFSNGEIAERLFISVKTAGHHVSNILTKLGLRSRTEAAAFASVHLPSEPAAR
jgi:DNA-binding CsgD family transcriptional regulator/predicted negative regulator of RcsB-dependent stress response